MAEVEHQVDKRRKRGNSLNRVRCSWKAAFMLVREISIDAAMMIPGRVGYYYY